MIRPLANLYEQLRRLPGIGSKTAMRLAYHVIDMPAEDVKQLAAALSACACGIDPFDKGRQSASRTLAKTMLGG